MLIALLFDLVRQRCAERCSGIFPRPGERAQLLRPSRPDLARYLGGVDIRILDLSRHMSTEGYDKTTVQDLIDRADVGRSTFYAHYETKDDLLISSFDQLAAEMELHMAREQTDAGSIMPGLALFRHLAENYHLYKAMIGSRGIDIATQIVHGRLLRHAGLRRWSLAPKLRST